MFSDDDIQYDYVRAAMRMAAAETGVDLQFIPRPDGGDAVPDQADSDALCPRCGAPLVYLGKTDIECAAGHVLDRAEYDARRAEPAPALTETAEIAHWKAIALKERMGRLAAEQRCRELEYLQSGTMAALRNPHIKTERNTAVALAFEVTSSAAQARRDADGFVPLPQARVCEAAGLESRSSVARHIARLRDWGMLFLKKKPLESDPQKSLTWVKLKNESAHETLQFIARLDPEHPSGAGRRRGPRCLEHPDADVLIVERHICAECGTILLTRTHRVPCEPWVNLLHGLPDQTEQPVKPTVWPVPPAQEDVPEVPSWYMVRETGPPPPETPPPPPNRASGLAPAAPTFWPDV